MFSIDLMLAGRAKRALLLLFLIFHITNVHGRNVHGLSYKCIAIMDKYKFLTCNNNNIKYLIKLLNILVFINFSRCRSDIVVYLKYRYISNPNLFQNNHHICTDLYISNNVSDKAS